METVSPQIPIPIPIAILLQDLEFGGTQRYAIHLLKYLDRGLFAPELWVLRDGYDMVPLAQKAGAEPVWLSRSSWVGPAALTNLAIRLIRHRPYILYTLTVTPNIWGRLFGALTRVPVIVSSWRSLFPKQHEKLMWPLSTRIICNAEVLKRVMAERYGVDPRRIAVVPNTVDSDFFTPDCSEKAAAPTVVSIGRLVAEKDPVTLIEGFRLTAERMPEAHFDIIGDGYLEAKAKALIDKYSLQDRIRLLPARADVRPDFRRAWVFAMASVREASPNVILEAMATELPIVASRVGGIPELVEHGESGLLFDPGDALGLANALTDLLRNESRRLSMGKRGRQRAAADHSVERMIMETQRVFIEAANESVSSSRSRFDKVV